jgi:O-methyltransferase
MEEVRYFLSLWPFGHEVSCFGPFIMVVDIPPAFPDREWDEDIFSLPCLGIFSFDWCPADLRGFVIQELLLIYLTVLEIGTFIGFSTMGWSSAVGLDGHVTALEFSPEYAAIAEEAFAKNGIKNVDVVVGDATES